MNHKSPDDTSIYQGNVDVHSGSFRPYTTIIGQSSILPIDKYQKNNQWGNIKIKWTIDQMHIRNIRRMFYPRGEKSTFFFLESPGILLKIDHIFGHKTSINK
jgi:hypothetical protein